MKTCYLLFLTIISICSPVFAEETVSFNKELDGFDYPFDVETFSLKSQNQSLNMRYMDIGNKSSTKVIVLLHGKNFAGYYWDRVAQDLLKNEYRVIIPDQIGFGKSSKPAAYQYSFGQLALNTKKLLEHLHIEKYDVVGHSMGGMLAVTFTANYSSSVNKLILINPIGLEDYSRYVEFKDVNFFYQRELNASIEKAINYQKQNYYAGHWTEEYERLLEPLKGMLAGEDWPIVAWNNALTYGPIFSENIVDRLSEIKNPTVLIIGTRDTTGPGRGWLKEGVTRQLGQYNELGKNAKKQIKGSILIELPELGHMPQYENYDAFMIAFDKALTL